jgi:hypothetical protein
VGVLLDDDFASHASLPVHWGVLMLIYAIAAFSAYPLVGGITLGLAIFLFLMVFYDQVTLLVAQIGAFIATVGRNN